MIRPIDINLNAAHPELPLVEATTFTGAPSSVFIRGVPKAVGNWSITAVSVAVTYPDNTTTARAAVESAEGVWVATIPGTATSGRTTAGFRILADGIDENGAAVTGYVLGFADFAVLSFFPVPAPGETFFYLRYFDAMPTAAKKMDVTTIDGVLKFYNGTAWEAFDERAYGLAATAFNRAAQAITATNQINIALATDYYTSAQTDEAIDKLAAYYITADAQGNPFATHAALVYAQTYYSGGAVRTPTRNDYAVVSADETHGGAEWRYIYAVDAQGAGQWEPQYAVEGVIAYDNTVTPTSANGVKSSGIWSALWGALSALPTGFTSLYDWVVAQIAKLRDKLDLNVYSFGNPVASFADGFSVADSQGGGSGQRYTAPSGGETITFVGPVPSSNPYLSNYKFYYPSTLGTLDSFDPDNYSMWCLVCPNGGTIPSYMMYKTGPYYYIGSFNSATPTLTLGIGEASGGEPTMVRPLGATGDTLAKVSQMNTALAGKANDDAVVKLTGDQDIGGNKTFYGDVAIVNEKDLDVQGGRVAVRSQGGSDVALFEYDRLEYSTDGGMTWTSIMLDNIAPLVSPAFTGTPTAPTPSSGDDSTKVATTAFVQGAVPYALVTKTITNGAVSLDDRAINAVAVSSSLASLTINFPTATSGKARDFGLRLTVASGVTTAPQIVLPQGVTCENADGEAPEIGADGAATILYFTETASGVFLVKGEVLQTITA